MSQHGKALDEQTPLLPPGPTVVDAVDDSVRHVDANVRLGKDEKKKVSVLQGACCVVALGLLVFLQGMRCLTWTSYMMYSGPILLEP